VDETPVTKQNSIIVAQSGSSRFPPSCDILKRQRRLVSKIGIKFLTFLTPVM